MPPARGQGRGRGSRLRASKTPSTLLQDPQESDLSTAPGVRAPCGHNVWLAHTGVASKAELAEASRRGIEAISDASTALCEPLVPVRPWRQLWDDNARSHPPHRQAAGEGSHHGEWRTTSLTYPCSCNLPSWPHAYIPPTPPPTTAELDALPPHPEPAQVPRFGNDVLPWSVCSTDSDNEVYLDRGLDVLQDFEHEWATAAPWPTRNKGKGRALPPPSSSVATQRSPVAFLTQRSPPDRHVTQRSPPRDPSSTTRPTATGTNKPPPSSNISTPSLDDTPLPDDYVEDAHVRRTWWRDNDAATCGAFWSHVKRNTYPAPTSTLRPVPPGRDDSYRVPRNLGELVHPLHPDVGHYCAQARTRVYWLIPIHGHVIVPGLEDLVTNPEARPWASRAVFTDGEKLEDSPPSKPAVVRWTPSLLNAFITEYFVPTWRDLERPYGPLHLAFSGPKPDPYLRLEPPRPLEEHQVLPPGKTGRAPVRPEAGDHLRIYCDASRALGLRTWLHSWEVEIGNGEGEEHTEGDGGRKMRPFDKVRFTLVGPRGEVLVVA